MAEIRSNEKNQKNIGSERTANKNGKASKNPPIPEVSEINFDYIKSNQFRVIHVDGLHGGISPKGLIQIAFFSERLPIPRQETYVLEKGNLGKRTKVDERKAVVREVEIETLIDLQLAKVIVKWLEERILQAENMRKETDSK